MAEVQTNDLSGEMTQRFIEFVMMQAQQAAFYLGQIPHPQTGKGEVNLDVAKMIIDQIVMIRAKTRGNLSSEEQSVLNNAISNLQMAFVEASQPGGAKAAAEPPQEISEVKTTDAAASESPSAEPKVEAAPLEAESKKKFTKSYGA